MAAAVAAATADDAAIARLRHRAHDPNTSSATLDVGHAEFPPNDAAAKAFREHSALVKGGRSLVSMNQPGAFDGPGCAWTVAELERQSDYWLEEQSRLTEPMRHDREADKFPAPWDEAFALIGQELRALADPKRGGILCLRPDLQRSII